MDALSQTELDIYKDAFTCAWVAMNEACSRLRSAQTAVPYGLRRKLEHEQANTDALVRLTTALDDILGMFGGSP